MSTELTREQLLEYVKKQRIKIKKLETDLQAAQQLSSTNTDATPSASNTDEIAEKDAKLAKCSSDLAERDSRIGELLAQLQDKEGAISGLQVQLSGLRSDLDKNSEKDAQLGKYAADLIEKDGRLSELLSKLQDKDAVIASLEGQLSGLRADLEKYAATREELTRTLSQYENVVGLNRQLEDTISRLKTEFSAEMSSVSQELKDTQARLAEQSQWREECNKLTSSLEQIVKDAARLEQEVETLKKLRADESNEAGKASQEEPEDKVDTDKAIHQDGEECGVTGGEEGAADEANTSKIVAEADKKDRKDGDTSKKKKKKAGKKASADINSVQSPPRPLSPQNLRSIFSPLAPAPSAPQTIAPASTLPPAPAYTPQTPSSVQYEQLQQELQETQEKLLETSAQLSSLSEDYDSLKSVLRRLKGHMDVLRDQLGGMVGHHGDEEYEEEGEEGGVISSGRVKVNTHLVSPSRHTQPSPSPTPEDLMPLPSLLESLTSQLKQQKQLLDQKNSILQEKTVFIEQVEGVINALLEEKRVFEETISALTAEKDAYYDELVELRGENNMQRQEGDDVNDGTDQNNENNQNGNLCGGLLGELYHEIDRLKQSLDALAWERDDIVRELEDVKRLEATECQMKDTLQLLESERDEARRAHSDLQGKVVELEDALKGAKEELEGIQRIGSSKSDEEQSRQTQWEEEKVRLMETLAVLKEEKEGLIEELAGVRAEKEGAQESVCVLEQQLIDARKDKDRLEGRVKQVEEELVRVKSELEQQLLTANMDKEKIEHKAADLLEELHNMETAKNALVSRIQEMEEQKGLVLEQEKGSMQKDVEKAQEEKRVLQINIKTLESELNKVQREKEGVVGELQKVREDLEVMETRVKGLESELASAKGELEGIRQAKDTLDASERLLREELGVVRKELENVSAAKESSLNRAKELEDECKKLKDEKQGVEIELDGVRKDLEAAAAREQELRVKETSAGGVEDREKAEKEKSDREEHIKKLTLKLKMKMKEAQDLQAQLTRMAEEAKDAQQKCKEAEERVKETEQQVKNTQYELKYEREKWVGERETLTSDLHTHRNNVKQLEEKVETLKSLLSNEEKQFLEEKTRLSGLMQGLEREVEGLKREKGEGKEREEALGGQIKKLKMLLQKVNTSYQESQQKLKGAGGAGEGVGYKGEVKVLWKLRVDEDVLKRLRDGDAGLGGVSGAGEAASAEGLVPLLSRVLTLLTSQTPTSSPTPVLSCYCLLLCGEEGGTEGTSALAQRIRFVSEDIFHEYQSNPNVTLTYLLSPSPSSDLLSLTTAHYMHLLRPLSLQVTYLSQELSTEKQSFQSYKVRAANALKRIHTEEQKAEMLTGEVEKLTSSLQEAQARVQNLEDSKERLERQVREVAGLKDRLEVRQQELEEEVRRGKEEVGLWEGKEKVWTEEKKGLEVELEKVKADCDGWMGKAKELEEKVDSLKNRVSTLSGPLTSPPANPNPSMAITPTISNAGAGAGAGATSPDHAHPPTLAPIQPPETLVPPPEPSPSNATASSNPAPASRSVLKRPPSLYANNKGGAGVVGGDIGEKVDALGTPTHELLAHQQVDLSLQQALDTMRADFSMLMAEVMEMRGEIALRDEQIATLKAAIRELEADLLREKEFHQGGAGSGAVGDEGGRVNVEYLVNSMRKFLNTSDASERSKLAQVMCSLLHLPAAETQKIAEVWKDRSSGGLVGWLLPPPTPVKNISKPSPRKEGGRSDLTYDPFTGSGIDYHNHY
eukprot:gene23918-28961_t